jgi:hypothetical protein
MNKDLLPASFVVALTLVGGTIFHTDDPDAESRRVRWPTRSGTAAADVGSLSYGVAVVTSADWNCPTSGWWYWST